MKPRKKILIVDDHRMFREGLAFLISHLKDYEIAGEAADGLAFLEMIGSVETDLAIMDISMPRMNGIEAAKTALAEHPDLKILILTMSCSREDYNELVNAGVSGFLLKDSGKEELIKALEHVFSGEKFYSQKLLQKMIVKTDFSTQVNPVANDLSLTPDERDVLQLLCQGYSTNNISEKLSISVRTVETYKSELMVKTGARNLVCLAVYAIKNQLLML